jgi:hypothetical protein
MSEKCGVRLTVHSPEDGHERPGRLSLLFVRTIGLCAAALISWFSLLTSLFAGGTLLLEGFPSSILGVVVLLTGVIVIPVSSFYGVMAFTRG